MPITGSILDTAERHPEWTAIASAADTLTYAELLEDGRRVSAVIEELGRGTDVLPVPEAHGIPITAISLTSAFHTARIVAGLAGYQAISSVIDPRWPIDHQAGVIVSSGAAVVVSDSPALAEALGERGWRGRIVRLGEFQDLETSIAPSEGPSVRRGGEPFLLLFSSGTTQAPKAFLKTRYQYRQNFAISSSHLEPLPGEATLAPGPVSYSLTLYAIIEALASGGSIHLMDQSDPIAVAARIHDAAITRIVAVPALVRGLLAAGRRGPALERVRLVVTGGANLSADTRTRFQKLLPGARLISYYGAAEIGFIGDSRSGDGTMIDIYPGVEVQVRDDDGSPLPEGALGSIWVRAEACSDDYVANTTEEHLQKEGWASVHDQGRLITGRLQLAGRAGDIAVTGGHKVSLTEVERAFEGMPGLGSVCAVALPNAELGQVVALVVEGDAPEKSTLMDFARSRLAPQFVPLRWYSVPRLERTVGGKVRRGAVTSQIHSGQAQVVRL
jgi:acyl-CoA synthetase (AMP-forming)/AMP-acid ligase II